MPALTDPTTAKARADWERAAARVLDPPKTRDGIPIHPLPAAAATADLLLARRDPAGWTQRTIVAESDPRAARRMIAEDVAGGAHSIIVQLATPGAHGLAARFDAISAALKDLPLRDLEIGFRAGDQYFGALQCLMALWDEHGIRAHAARVAIHADPLGTLAVTGALEAGLWPSLELLGQFVGANIGAYTKARLVLADGAPYHEAGASKAQELAIMLATAVEYLRVLSFDGVTADDLFPVLTVGLTGDSDLFLTTAKVRAARMLLARVAQTCGARDGIASSVDVWVRLSQRMPAGADPHTGTLRGTMAALGAVLGGADSLTVEPVEAGSDARRLVLRTGAIMAAESGLADVADPVSGSAHVRALTDALAAKAWEEFQQIERDGGMARALLAGSVQARILGAQQIDDRATGEHRALAPIVKAETRIAPLPRFRSFGR